MEKINKQASVIVFREIRPEYYAPLGVGILREVTRDAFRNAPERFESVSEALSSAQKRLRMPVSTFERESILLKEYGKQKKLRDWL